MGRIVPPVHMGLYHKTRFCNLGVTAPVRLDAPDAHFVVADDPGILLTRLGQIGKNTIGIHACIAGVFRMALRIFPILI